MSEKIFISESEYNLLVDFLTYRTALSRYPEVEIHEHIDDCEYNVHNRLAYMNSINVLNITRELPEVVAEKFLSDFSIFVTNNPIENSFELLRDYAIVGRLRSLDN